MRTEPAVRSREKSHLPVTVLIGIWESASCDFSPILEFSVPIRLRTTVRRKQGPEEVRNTYRPLEILEMSRN
jgi:hypothetical protein